MEDDIDIEEHDILQDPRIKKLFSDVSQFKIEINDAGARIKKLPNLLTKFDENRSNFKVLTYNPEELLTPEWLKIFQNVPASQTREIIKSSLYSIERSVTMKLIKEGRIEYTLYVCSVCQICFQNSEIALHMTEKCLPSANICKICSLKFKDLNALQYHELLHKCVKKEDFRIVHFIKNVKIYVLYKCSGCQCCLRKKKSISGHKCPIQNRVFKCLSCNQLYPKNMRKVHEQIHDEEADFTENNMQIEYFEPENGDRHKTTKGKVYKCDCGLHFTSLLSVAKHKDNCSPSNQIHSERCSKCNLLFPTDVLVSHLCKHHSNNTEIVIEEYKSNSDSHKTPINDFDYKLYRCKECDIYFLTQSTCYSHVVIPHKAVDLKHECHICGLSFTAKSLYMHKRKHHEKFFNLNRVLIEDYHPATENELIKIDIYMATDKLQSLIVSSST